MSASTPAPFDPERILAVLARHGVDFVLVGALAARLHGFPRLTADTDVTPDATPENVARLSAALRELDARVYTEAIPEGLPFDCSPPTLLRAHLWNLVSSAGRIDVIFEPAGCNGYADLRSGAERFEVHGAPLLVASLRDLVRMKEAADRPQDRQDVVILREMLRGDSDGSLGE